MAFESILANLPAEPGVYIYKDANGTVIYVGKARVLKNRVRSYFHSSSLTPKTKQLVSNIADINYIVTSNELEALLLENNLIKKYKPKYNILLKDDKGYPYLRIDVRESYPKLELARKMAFDGAQYFGPYHGGGSAKAIAELATSLYPLRSCNFTSFENVRPCLKYHINKCPAPCAKDCKSEYRQNVQNVIAFLKGDDSAVLDTMRKKMEAAAERLDFETAAEIRDKIKKADEILSKQKIVLDRNTDIDVVSVMIRNTYGVICSLYVRSGRLTGVNTREFTEVFCTEEELLREYLIQNYTSGAMIPKEIVCDRTPEDIEPLSQLISEKQNKKVIITVPQRGKKAELCLMAKRNAREKIEKSSLSAIYRNERTEHGMRELAETLGLKTIPARMECFDISHIQGTDTVASMVVFSGGVPNKKEYRRFKIQHPGNDDFASMREVTFRRYSDGKNQKPGFEKLPDLIIIDGGKGQLSSAYSIIHEELGLNIPMIGLAKRLEEIYLPGQPLPILLPLSSPAIQILQAIRDEAHRFAITFHRSLRNKHSLVSRLDSVPGIGEKRRKALFRAFGSVEKIKQADLKDIENVDGMNKPSSLAVYEYFNSEKDLNDKT